MKTRKNVFKVPGISLCYRCSQFTSLAKVPDPLRRNCIVSPLSEIPLPWSGRAQRHLLQETLQGRTPALPTFLPLFPGPEQNLPFLKPTTVATGLQSSTVCACLLQETLALWRQRRVSYTQCLQPIAPSTVQGIKWVTWPSQKCSEDTHKQSGSHMQIL